MTSSWTGRSKLALNGAPGVTMWFRKTTAVTTLPVGVATSSAMCAVVSALTTLVHDELNSN